MGVQRSSIEDHRAATEMKCTVMLRLRLAMARKGIVVYECTAEELLGRARKSKGKAEQRIAEQNYDSQRRGGVVRRLACGGKARCGIASAMIGVVWQW